MIFVSMKVKNKTNLNSEHIQMFKCMDLNIRTSVEGDCLSFICKNASILSYK